MIPTSAERVAMKLDAFQRSGIHAFESDDGIYCRVCQLLKKNWRHAGWDVEITARPRNGEVGASTVAQYVWREPLLAGVPR